MNWKCKHFGHSWTPIVIYGSYGKKQVKFIGAFCQRCRMGYDELLDTIEKQDCNVFCTYNLKYWDKDCQKELESKYPETKDFGIMINRIIHTHKDKNDKHILYYTGEKTKHTYENSPKYVKMSSKFSMNLMAEPYGLEKLNESE